MIRIAFLAYACKTGDGSEPGAGFLWALAAAQVGKVTIITRPLDDETRQELYKAGIVVHELEVRHSKKIPQLSYIRWLLQAQSRLRELHLSEPFSIVHHATYATDWLPAPSIKGIPLIWGPVGGSTGLPPGLGKHFSAKLRSKEAARSIITGTVRAVTKQWASTRVTTLIAQNNDTAESYRGLVPIYVRPNYIVDGRKAMKEKPLTKRIAMVGRLIEMKGVHLAIAALSSAELRDWELHIIGDGPMRSQLQQEAQKLGVAARVTFHGQVSRELVYEHLQRSRCSLLLSTHDAAGWAAAESIAVGTPVYTWNHGGPAELVNLTGCGTAIDPDTQAVPSLAAAIARMGDIPSADMSRFAFNAVVQDLRNWYDEAIK